MTQAQIQQLVAAIVSQTINAKALKQADKPAKRSKAEWLAAKDKSTVAAFKRRGIKDVVLMNRDDRDLPFNVRPFGRKDTTTGQLTGWLAEGKIVKKGEKSVNGLFHASQVRDMTDDEVTQFTTV